MKNIREIENIIKYKFKKANIFLLFYNHIKQKLG